MSGITAPGDPGGAPSTANTSQVCPFAGRQDAFRPLFGPFVRAETVGWQPALFKKHAASLRCQPNRMPESLLRTGPPSTCSLSECQNRRNCSHIATPTGPTRSRFKSGSHKEWAANLTITLISKLQSQMRSQCRSGKALAASVLQGDIGQDSDRGDVRDWQGQALCSLERIPPRSGHALSH